MGVFLTLIGNFIANFAVKIFFAILEKAPEWLVDRISDRLSPKQKNQSSQPLVLVDPTCGNRGLELRQQRLKISSAFGSYFTGLLERDQNYINLEGQIKVSGSQQSGMEPFQAIYWSLQNAQGPQVLIIAAEAGMGKSTLAAKIIRCLYDETAIDLILGDSAKSQNVDPISGRIQIWDPAYYDLDTFLVRICAQLGLNYVRGKSNQQRTLGRIKDRLAGRQAILVVDNLESLQNGADLLNALRQLAGRDMRIIVTTRKVNGIAMNTPGTLLIHLEPLTEIVQAQNFLLWHIHTFAVVHPALQGLERDLKDKGRMRLLIRRTGGIPLLLQLIISDIARSSWAKIEQMPDLYGKELLNFLYRERWEELGQSGAEGQIARAILFFIQKQSFRSKITDRDLLNWAKETLQTEGIEQPLQLLEERFLVINSNHDQGNYSIFPSLSEFLRDQIQAMQP